jgi:hypothetical protein
MIACSVDDFGPIPTEQISTLDEQAQEYFYIVESESLDEIRAAAIDHCGEWFASTVESLIEDLPDSSDQHYWSQRAIKILWRMPEALARVAKMTPQEDDLFVGVTSLGDWIRIEEV